MARTRRATPSQGAQAETPPANVQVTVPVTASTIKVADLKNPQLSEKDINDLLQQAKTAKVGFVILNAPFKVRTLEPVS
jgi:hypothetical protein